MHSMKLGKCDLVGWHELEVTLFLTAPQTQKQSTTKQDTRQLQLSVTPEKGAHLCTSRSEQKNTPNQIPAYIEKLMRTYPTHERTGQETIAKRSLSLNRANFYHRSYAFFRKSNFFCDTTVHGRLMHATIELYTWKASIISRVKSSLSLKNTKVTKYGYSNSNDSVSLGQLLKWASCYHAN